MDAFVAPNATLVGDVLMLTQSSVWYGAVLRGDRNKITVGAFSNIQDKVVIDCSNELDTGFPAEVDILNHVTIGHGAVLRSCVIKDRCIVGMNAVISEGCVMERTSMVAAGSVLLPHSVVPSGQLWAGNPAVYIRDLKFEEIESFEKVLLQCYLCDMNSWVRWAKTCMSILLVLFVNISSLLYLFVVCHVLRWFGRGTQWWIFTIWYCLPRSRESG